MSVARYYRNRVPRGDRRVLAIAACCAACVLTACERPDPPPAEDPIEAAREIVSTASGKGASGVLRIAYGDEVLLETGFGSASCDTDEAVTADHLFMIGSITKEFTQVLGYVLEERGHFSREDALSEVLTGFAGPIGAVSLQQLIDHTGGLPDIIDADGRPIAYTIDYDYEPVDRDEMISRAEQAELIFTPGESEEYSNLGYQLLAAAYEEATGESYPDLLRRYIYEPAGIGRTDFWFEDADLSFADGCGPGGARWGNPIDDAMWSEAGPSRNLMGAGGLISTAESLGKFFSGIGSGVYFETREQSEKYKADRMVYSERREQYIMGPGGSNGVFDAAAFWADDEQFSLVMMTNRSDFMAEDGLIRDVLAVFPRGRLERFSDSP